MSSYDGQSQDLSTCPYNNKILMAAIISLAVTIIFFLLLHAYARWFLSRRLTPGHVAREPLRQTGHSADHGGLDAKVLAALPTFVYKSEDHSKGVVACVICLSAMQEADQGKILPACNHVFHVACIDVWLMSHSTCPICRTLILKSEEPSVEAVDTATPAPATEAAAEHVHRSTEEELVMMGDGVSGLEFLVEVPLGSISAADGVKEEC